MKINSDINCLSEQFKIKVSFFLKEAKEKWFNIKIYEWFRSKERQYELFGQGRTMGQLIWLWIFTKYSNLKKPIVTWTLDSKHLSWNAVDIVFINSKWKITWDWDYDSLIDIAIKYWINNLKPKESCHFEDNGTPLIINNFITMSEFKDVMDKELADSWFKSLFDNIDWETYITKQEVKELINIAFARFFNRLKG